MKKCKLELDQKALSSIMDEWFQHHDINDKNIMHNNPVARSIKNNLKDIGRWKGLPRGKPYTEKPIF